MTTRVASHRIATLHGLFGRSHANAIERTANDSEGKYGEEQSSYKPHENQNRGPP